MDSTAWYRVGSCTSEWARAFRSYLAVMEPWNPLVPMGLRIIGGMTQDGV